MNATTSDRHIHLLPERLIASIAAGEVVERPVSVVRELLDNAIDAGATRIAVEIEGGGIALIRVSDNGHGIPPDEVEMAFERHATSKLSGDGDLGTILTLGFRGEALPSIAAAADIEITTRHRDEPVAVRAVYVQGRPAGRRAAPSPVGTTIAVRELFGRVPARRAFMGTEQSESRLVRTLVMHYALAYPEIAFSLSSGGRSVASTPGTGSMRHAFAALHGTADATAMLDIDHEGDGVVVQGLAGPPSLHRGNRSLVSVFVNRRWVQSRALTFAIVDAYRDQLPVGRHPVAAIDVRLPSDQVDVNVHPAKAEVRFRDERAVARAIRHGIRAALEGTAPPPMHISPPDWQTEAANAPTLRDRLAASFESAPDALSGAQPTQSRMELPHHPTTGPDDRPGAPAATPQREVLPLLRVVGQMAATYVLCEGPDGLYMVDQHAAHERVLYDRLVHAPVASAASQPLLEPVVLELDAMQAATIEIYQGDLERLGFALDPFGERTWLVRAIPPALGSSDPAAEVQRLLDELDRETAEPHRFNRAAATVACHGSVRAGMALSTDEMRALIRDLEVTESPRTCPHGRPTILHLSRDALERQFRRR